MTRALSLSCLALVLLAGSAFAGKPSIAILGLEVGDASGTPTPADTQIAKELTDGLRSRAIAGSGPFTLAPGSDKELIDLKLLSSCDSEATSCMSAIGDSLHADMLMYGHIEKQGKAYLVTLKLLDVRQKRIEKSVPNTQIPLSQASGASLKGWAKNMYANLTSSQAAGSIVVKVANAERGTILVDRAEKGNITNGVGQVSGLDEGKHKVAIESQGFQRWEQDITVRSGESQTIDVHLDKADSGGGGSGGSSGVGGDTGVGPGGLGVVSSSGEGPSASGGGGWHKWLYTSLGVGIVGGGLWYAGYKTIDSAEGRLCEIGGYADPKFGKPLCQGKPMQSEANVSHENDRGDRGHVMSWVGGGMVVAGVVGTGLILVYEGIIKKDSPSTERAMGTRRVHRDRFVVTPIVSPNGGGATLQLSW
jgi:hypothetical protein